MSFHNWIPGIITCLSCASIHMLLLTSSLLAGELIIDTITKIYIYKLITKRNLELKTNINKSEVKQFFFSMFLVRKPLHTFIYAPLLVTIKMSMMIDHLNFD